MVAYVFDNIDPFIVLIIKQSVVPGRPFQIYFNNDSVLPVCILEEACSSGICPFVLRQAFHVILVIFRDSAVCIEISKAAKGISCQRIRF